MTNMEELVNSALTLLGEVDKSKPLVENKSLLQEAIEEINRAVVKTEEENYEER